jgi:translocation and assembly module TamA
MSRTRAAHSGASLPRAGRGTSGPARWPARPRARAVLLAGAASLAACAAAPAKTDAPVVRALDFSGNSNLPAGEIKDKILTSKTGWWPFATKQHFDPIAWQSDMARIERLYETRGFYQAEVIKDEVVPAGPDAVKLKVSISEGPPSRISKLEIDGLDALPADQKEAVLRRFPLSTGATFLESEWEAAKVQLRQRLRALGYAAVQIDAQALIDFDTHGVALTLVVRPGPRCYFGEIHVKTAPGAKIPAAWIWEQARLAIPEGKQFSDAASDEAQRRIFGMGLFAAVKVTPGEPDPKTSRIAVTVDAQEAPFRALRLGGGVHVDEIRNEARLLSEWTDRNFEGGMRKLTLHLEVGWAFLPNAYAVLANQVADAPLRNGPIARTSVGFEQPRLLGRPSLRERSLLEVDRTLEQTYNAISTQLTNGVVWQPHSSLSIFPAYHLEVDYLNGPPINSAASAPLTLGCVTSSSSCVVLLSYLEELITWDKRDDLLEPRHGWYASLSLQEGGGPLAGDFTYLRALPELRGYYSFGEEKQLTFSARLRAGDLWPESGDPDSSAVVTRFYAGGAQSMRGFNDRRLSPLLEAPAPPVPGVAPSTLTLPIGGNGIIDGSYEVRYSFTKNLRVAAFVDFGQVTRGTIGPDDFVHLLWAVGVGVRYLTPVGPIRVDLARRLQLGRLPPLFAIDPSSGQIAQMSYPVDTSCFGIGGTQPNTPVTDNLCVLHVSIGEAF